MIYIIIGALTTIVISIFTYSEKLKDNKEKQKSNKITNCCLVVFLIGTIVSVFSGIKSEIKQNNSDLSKKISDSLNTLKSDSIHVIVSENYQMSDSIKNISSKLSLNEDSLKDISIKLYKTEEDINKIQSDQLDTTKSIITKQNISISKLTNLLKEVTGNDNKPVIGGIATHQYKEDSILIELWVNNKSKYPILGTRLNLREIYEDTNRTEDKIIELTPGDFAPNTTNTIFSKKLHIWNNNKIYGYVFRLSWTRGFYQGSFTFTDVNKEVLKLSLELTNERGEPLPKNYFNSNDN